MTITSLGSLHSISDVPSAPAAAPATPAAAPTGPMDGFTPSDELSEQGGIGGCGSDQEPCSGDSGKGSESSSGTGSD